MLTRRNIIGLLPFTSLLLTTASFARMTIDIWESWKSLYLESGRVIDHGQGGISHSEGQAYGLLFAQAFEDRLAFREIEDWSLQNLVVRRDRLMAWKWQPSSTENITDWRNATDGDLLRAWALLRASRISGWTEYESEALAIAHDIVKLCLARDPRAENALLLIPGAEARQSAERVLFNPSYIMPQAMTELAVAAKEPRLLQAATHGTAVLAELAAVDLLPNWIDVTTEGFAKPEEHDLLWGYDALRIPLYLTWSGLNTHPAVELSINILHRSEIFDHLVVEMRADGHIRAQSNHPGFHAISRLAKCESPFAFDDTFLHGSYYADSLLLLAAIAGREANCHA